MYHCARTIWRLQQLTISQKGDVFSAAQRQYRTHPLYPQQKCPVHPIDGESCTPARNATDIASNASREDRAVVLGGSMSVLRFSFHSVDTQAFSDSSKETRTSQGSGQRLDDSEL